MGAFVGNDRNAATPALRLSGQTAELGAYLIPGATFR
jgi:hypothetical protein